MKKCKFIPWRQCNFLQKIARTIVFSFLLMAVISVNIFIDTTKTTAKTKTLEAPKDIDFGQIIQRVKVEEEPEYNTEYEYSGCTNDAGDTEFVEYEEYTESTEDTEYTGIFSDYDIIVLAQTLYGEANCVDITGKEMVVWCILNRYDSGLFGDTIAEICTTPYQFDGYDPSFPVTDENLEIIYNVIHQWELERQGYEVYRTLPSEYLYFVADSVPEIGYWSNVFYKYTNITDGDKVYYNI